MSKLDIIHSHLGTELSAMNNIITATLHTSNPLMDEVVSGYLKTKGKQIRPILVLLSAKLFGDVNPRTLHAAAALEMLHNASLIHDDVVDETSLRRGSATINFTWGNHIAVLVGDYFVSNALQAGIATGNIEIISSLSALGKELSLGEIDQICNVRDHNFDERSYTDMIRKKTASLFMNCVKMGAESVGVDKNEYAPLVRFAELLGVCFQIKDDIFDYFADDKIGKPTGNDLREGKVTLPLLYVLNTGEKSVTDGYKELLRRGDLSADEINSLIDYAVTNGGIDYAFECMRQYKQEAMKELDKYPASEARDIFADIFDFIIDRDY